MFFYEGQSCPVCQKPFQETDDIVSCPQCGAPHHRDCWQQEGHCHFEAFHGTDRQWTRPDPASQETAPPRQVCPNCGQDNPEFSEICGHCGRSLPPKNWSSVPPPPGPPAGGYGEYSPFVRPVIDTFGGVPRDEVIEDATAEEIHQLVGVNTTYYLPRFSKMSKTGSKISWNWAAFFIPPCWLLFRKNLFTGLLVLLFSITRSILTNLILYQYLAPYLSFDSYPALFNSMRQAMYTSAAQPFIALLAVFMLLELMVRLLCGLYGNWLYRQTLLKKARRRREDPNNFPMANSIQAGGVSFMLGTTGYLAIWLIETILMYMQL